MLVLPLQMLTNEIKKLHHGSAMGFRRLVLLQRVGGDRAWGRVGHEPVESNL
jgi:hypothetical protein